MLLLAGPDAAHVIVADESGWRAHEVPSGRVSGRGQAGELPGAGGRWELDDQGVAWRAGGGNADPKWSGRAERVALAPDALWVQAGDTLVRIGADVRTRREPGVKALSADAGGAVWATAERLERVDGDGRLVCALALEGAEPRAVAASAAWIALADKDGLLLVDAARCTPVAASAMRVDALAFVGTSLWALRDGSLRALSLPTLDAVVDRGDPGLLPLDAPDRPRLVDATGIHDPHAGGFLPIPAEHLVTAGAVIGREGGRLRAWDATGRVLADLGDPLVALSLGDVAGDAVVASDGTRVVFSGGGVTTPGFAFDELRAVDAATALVRSGARWWKVRASGAPERVSSPWDGVRGGPVAWLDAAAGSALYAASAVADGFRVVRRADGHVVGAPILAVPGKRVAIDPDGRTAVTRIGDELVAFDVASGKARWRRKDALGAWDGVERADRAAVVTATGAELRLVDPTGGQVVWRVVDGEHLEAAGRSWRPGDPALPWTGRPIDGPAAADGGVSADPLAIAAAFGWAAAWNPAERSRTDWAGWCGRADEAASLLRPYPALAARVAMVLGDCDRAAPAWVSTKVEEHAAPAPIDEPCTDPIATRLHDELHLPLQAGRPTLVVAGPSVEAPPGVDLLELGDGAEDYRADATLTYARLRRARPLPACLAALGDLDGAVLVDGTGRARLRGESANVARAAATLASGEGAEAPPPVQRWTAAEPFVGVAGDEGVVVAWTAGRLGRLGANAWTTAVEAVGARVVDTMVVVQERGWVRALSTSDGRFLWRLRGSLVGAQGKRALLSERGVTRAVDARGEVAWTHAALGDVAGDGFAWVVASWRCTRDATWAPRVCARDEAPEVVELRVGDGVQVLKGRRTVLSLPSATEAALLGGGRVYVGGPGMTGRIYGDEGRLLQVLPRLDSPVVEGGRVWGVRGDGSVEVYRP